jgi:hypothetical protein
MAPYEALYGCKCRSPLYWEKAGERQLVAPKIIQDTKDKVALIRKIMLTAQSRQKSYVNKGRLLVNFEVGDQVFLKVSPTKGVMRFGKKGKLSPRYVHDPLHVVDFGPLHI